MVPGEDLVAPGEDGVDYGVELAKFAGGVEVSEPVESFEGAIVVVDEVEAVEWCARMLHSRAPEP